MLLINWKFELQNRWTKHCVLALVDVDNNGAESFSNIFTIKDEKLYTPIVTLLELKDQCIEMNRKQKLRTKIR